MTASFDAAALRRLVYALLITVAFAGVCGRIATTSLVYEPELFKGEYVPKGRAWPSTPPRPMPTFSSNDRSRWATVRALVDEGTFVVGKRDPKTGDTGIIFEDGWKSVDKVLHPEKQEFYSSKPPLLSVVIAGFYWLLQLLTGWTLADRPFSVVRTILIVVNALPFALYLVVLARWVERLGTTNWGRLIVVTAGAFATLVTSFAVTLNNHSLAAYGVLFAMLPLLRCWFDGTPPSPLGLIVSGLLAGFTVTNELPAASFAVAVFVLLLWNAPIRTLLFFVPGVLIPIGGMFWLNYLSIGQWRPAYSEFGGPWYEYEGSHWRNVQALKTGIDAAGYQESQAAYVFHCLLGHHGLFSLTPVWLLSALGIGLALWRRMNLKGAGEQSARTISTQAWIAILTATLTMIVLGFYLTRDASQRNYGGWTTGLRWLMWLTPLWLLTLLPAADWLARSRWGRGFGYVLLGMSVFSVAFAAWNPWRHPWIYQLMEGLGWPGY